MDWRGFEGVLSWVEMGEVRRMADLLDDFLERGLRREAEGDERLVFLGDFRLRGERRLVGLRRGVGLRLLIPFSPSSSKRLVMP